MKPLADEDIIYTEELLIIQSNLQSLAKTGELTPVVIPKLIDQSEAAEMLGISLANYKKIEREGRLPFKRIMVGSSVRYRNTDIVDFIMTASSAEG